MRMTSRPPKITYTGSRLPSISGTWSAAILVLCFALSAVLLPVAAHLPRWVEFELVLVVWWLVWTVAIAWMLYRGCAIADDMPVPKGPSLGTGEWSTPDLTSCLWPDPFYADGCGTALVVVGALIMIAAGIWLAVEILIPGVGFLLYLLIRGMMARAVSDRRDCQGSVLRAAIWGMAWATLYTAPLALTVLAVHSIHPHLRH